jgi:transcriptional regulator with XRE-family HTH domain
MVDEISSLRDNAVNKRMFEVRKALNLNQIDFAKKIKISRGYASMLETSAKEINDRIIQLICMNCGINEKWLRTGKGAMFADTFNPLREKVMYSFDQLDDHLQEYVVKQMEILLECENKRKPL